MTKQVHQRKKKRFFFYFNEHTSRKERRGGFKLKCKKYYEFKIKKGVRERKGEGGGGEEGRVELIVRRKW
jgi:hypothetical protein